jgi:hypothetical protein
MSNDTKYNGWTNYETWNVALWLDNEQSSERCWRATAQECYDEATITTRLGDMPIFTREENARRVLEDKLKEEVTESMPDLGSSMAADLLGAALSEVNWREIAEHYILDVDKTEEDDEDEDEDEDDESDESETCPDCGHPVDGSSGHGTCDHPCHKPS